MTEPNLEKSESDVGSDSHVAASRAGNKGDDSGSYVGRTGSDDALVGETGAEARIEHG